MPTYEVSGPFEADLEKLTPRQRILFAVAVMKFVEDPKRGAQIRKRLRIKPYRGRRGWFEMTWAPDGRALFRYGEPLHPGDVHVIWERVGSESVPGVCPIRTSRISSWTWTS